MASPIRGKSGPKSATSAALAVTSESRQVTLLANVRMLFQQRLPFGRSGALQVGRRKLSAISLTHRTDRASGRSFRAPRECSRTRSGARATDSVICRSPTALIDPLTLQRLQIQVDGFSPTRTVAVAVQIRRSGRSLP
jgi:hypothetical protein